MGPQLPCHASSKRKLLSVKLQPGCRYVSEEAGSVEIMRARELRIGGILSTNTQDVVQQRRDRYPLGVVRHAKRTNLLAYALQNAHRRQLARRLYQRRTNPWMRVHHIEHTQCELADRRFRGRRIMDIQSARDNGIAGRDEQVIFIIDMPINSAGAGSKPVRQRAKCQAALATAIQQRY